MIFAFFMSKPSRPHGWSVQFIRKRWLWLLPLLLWGGVVYWSLASNIATITRHHTEIAADTARGIFRIVQLTRLWNAQHGGVYVPVTEKTQPNPYLDVPDRDVVTDRGVALTKINPAFMTRQLAELITPENGTSFHITSLKPIRPKNRADGWEHAALERFENGTEEVFERITTASSDQFRYMAPLMVKGPCMKCHQKQGYQAGDVRGGISVTMEAAPIFGKSGDSIDEEIQKHLGIYLLVSAPLLLFFEKMRGQWLALEQLEQRQELIIEERTRELEHLATHDPLTRIYNRNALNHRLEQEFERSIRYQHVLSLLMLDLDHFKKVNDSFGHQVGDQVLSMVAEVVSEEVRKTDMVARFGGEEFVVLLPETTVGQASDLAERIRKRIAQQTIETRTGMEIMVSTSIGVAAYPQHARSRDSLLQCVDEAMYRAKHQGRNQVVVYAQRSFDD